MARYAHRILAAGAISSVTDAFTSERRLLGVTVHFSAAPTTSEYLTVSLDSADGPEYDVVIYRIDPAAASTTDIVYTDANLPLVVGDALRVVYANSDARTVGIRLVLE